MGPKRCRRNVLTVLRRCRLEYIGCARRYQEADVLHHCADRLVMLFCAASLRLGTPAGVAHAQGASAAAPDGAVTLASRRLPDPARGRYRVTLAGLTALRPTHDPSLGDGGGSIADGNGDEIFAAAWLARIDTGATPLVEHVVVRGRTSAGGGTLLRPLVLWEGELVQGRSVLLASPTVWESDGRPELYGYWVVSRGAVIDRLTTPDALLSLIDNRSPLPRELGSPALRLRPDAVGGARDRPVGLEPGRGVAGVSFVDPAAWPVRGATAATRILDGTPSARAVVDRYGTLLDRILAAAPVGASDALAQRIVLPTDPAASRARQEELRARVAALRRASGGGAVRGAPLSRLVPQLRAVVRDYTATELFFIEQTIVLTPAAIEEALRTASATGAGPRGTITVTYSDHGPLQGRYVMHLQVERVR